MIPNRLLERYQGLTAAADRAFRKMQRNFGALIRCKPGCSDCCHAPFGLFLIEAAFLKAHFDRLPRKDRREAINGTRKADRDLERLQGRLGESGMEVDFLGRNRVRCPLLNKEGGCILYAHRPITCRVYGIPTEIRGKGRVCRKSGFKEGETYPSFKLDTVQAELYALSREMVSGAGGDIEKASFLVSVSKALQTPLNEIETGSFK